MPERSQAEVGAAGVVAARAAPDRCVASNDALRAAGVFDPAYLLMTDDGIAFDRKAVLAAIGDRACRMSISEMRRSWVRVRGDTAVLPGVLKQAGAQAGVPFERSSLVTDTWIRCNGRWLLLAGRASVIDCG